MMDARYPDPKTIGDVIRVYCQMNGGVCAVADHLGISHSQISLMSRSKLRPNARVLAALGFRKLELYIPTECNNPALGLPWQDERS